MKNNGNHPENNLTDEDAISILVDGVISNEKNIEKELKDPFDIYTHQLRSKLYSHPQVFKERCLKGYRILLKDIP